MFFTNLFYIQIFIFVLALCGFLVAKHIRDHKVENKRLICMKGFDCHAVVHSDYSKFLTMPIELLGMIYYSGVALVYFVCAFSGLLMPDALIVILILGSLSSVVFSFYLIFVQLFAVKKWCSWCLVSAFISFFIFILTMMHHNFSFLAHLFIK